MFNVMMKTATETKITFTGSLAHCQEVVEKYSDMCPDYTFSIVPVDHVHTCLNCGGHGCCFDSCDAAYTV